MLAAAREVFEVPAERVALKSRERGKGGSKYGRFEQRNEIVHVREHGALLRVNLFDYLDTGLFLDHRPLRGTMAQQCRGRRFLNLFCYTGVASVEAAVAGAASTTSVDLSATYLQWCADNLALNGLAGSKHKLVQADALAWLEAERAHFDVIFCDPPTFSNSARAEDFDIQREHVRLLRAAVARLAPGVLYFSNNFRRFKLDEEGVAEFAQCEEISPAPSTRLRAACAHPSRLAVDGLSSGRLRPMAGRHGPQAPADAVARMPCVQARERCLRRRNCCRA